jgi:hypothetical protein
VVGDGVESSRVESIQFILFDLCLVVFYSHTNTDVFVYLLICVDAFFAMLTQIQMLLID